MTAPPAARWLALLRVLCITLCVGCLLAAGLSSLASAQTTTAPAPAPETGAMPAAERAEVPAVKPDQAANPDTVAILPRDLTPWGMFLAADIVVKAVMIGLAFASLVTWTIALAKWLELFAARRRVRRALAVLMHAASLSEASRQLDARQSLAPVVRAAMEEVRLSADIPDKSGIKERVALRLERIEANVGRRMARGTGLLATIGATAPFVGLFGTVWGIMNSFIGISRLHTTNLAVVAPGIAEALLATALGLAAAIPAVVVYNMFSRSIAAYRALYADGTTEVLSLVGRDLDRETGAPAAKGRRSATLSAAE